MVNHLKESGVRKKAFMKDGMKILFFHKLRMGPPWEITASNRETPVFDLSESTQEIRIPPRSSLEGSPCVGLAVTGLEEFADRAPRGHPETSTRGRGVRTG